jgi:hypothetical protein
MKNNAQAVFTRLDHAEIAIDPITRVVTFLPSTLFDGKLIAGNGWRMTPDGARAVAEKLIEAADTMDALPAAVPN